MTRNPEEGPIHGSVQHLNPETLHKNPAFTQVINVTGPARTIYIGGQDALDAHGNIVGKGDLAAQTQQVLINLRNALAAASARPEHIIKWNVYLVQGQSTRIFLWRWMPLLSSRSSSRRLSVGRRLPSAVREDGQSREKDEERKMPRGVGQTQATGFQIGVVNKGIR